MDKGVNCTSLCIMCEESYEDASHVLFDCPRARKIWQDCLLLSKVNSVMLDNNTAAELIFALLQELSCVQAELFATVLWSLWKSLNMRLWQNVTETSQDILKRARQLLFSWRDANRKQQNSRLAVQQHDSTAAAPAGLISAVQQLTDGENVVQQVQVRWQKPEHGRLKCNVDASFSEALNCVGFGFCIRDEAGNCVQAQTMWSNPVCLTDVRKDLGLSHAIRWVHALQLTMWILNWMLRKLWTISIKGVMI